MSEKREILNKLILEGEGIERQGGMYIDKHPKRYSAVAQASKSLSSALCGELEKEIKMRLLTHKKNLEHQLGWCEGHKKGVDDCISVVKKFFNQE